MKRFPRRDRMKIYGDLLVAIKEAKRQEEGIVLTRIQQKINVPYDRLKGYIFELRELGLIDNETLMNLTSKGQQYMIEYGNMLNFMERMGLTYSKSTLNY